MSNWCLCELTVSGPTDKVAEILVTIGDGRHILMSLLPAPPDLLERSAPPDFWLGDRARCYVGDEWQRWSYLTWGVMQDLDMYHLEYEADWVDARLALKFESSEAPPSTALDTIAGRNPELTFELTFDTERGTSGEAFWAGGARVGLKDE